MKYKPLESSEDKNFLMGNSFNPESAQAYW